MQPNFAELMVARNIFVCQHCVRLEIIWYIAKIQQILTIETFILLLR
jgi:hypothetical protein